MRTRPSPHIPGFERRSGRYKPRLSDLILGVTAVLVLLAACLRLLATAAA